MHTVAVESPRTGYTGNVRWYVRLLPSLTDFAFLLPAFLLCCVMPGAKRLLADGETGWHIRTGEWILQHSAVPKVDLFSFSKPNAPWFAWEWGWDVLFAWIHRAGGLAAVTFVNACLLCAISAVLFRLIWRCCGSGVLSFLFAGLAMCGSTVHWLARPHLVSWLLVLIFLHILYGVERGSWKPLIWLPILSVFWANLHGAFFIGVLLVTIAGCGAYMRSVGVPEEQKRAARLRARTILVSAICCLAATFVNPYMWGLHAHVFGYLSDTGLLRSIAEYQPITFGQGPAIFFECMLFAGAGAVCWCWQSSRADSAILILLWAGLALSAQRNIPYFLFIAAPWAASSVQACFERVQWWGGAARFVAAVAESCAELAAVERVRRVYATSGAALVAMACLFASGRPGFAAEFDQARFAIAQVPELATLSHSRIFTYDQWADYLIYRFFPDCRVFADSRSDFYGEDFGRTYVEALEAKPDWRKVLSTFRIETVILRPEERLTAVLRRERGWRLDFQNESVVVFSTDSGRRRRSSHVAERARISPQTGGSEPGVLPNAGGATGSTVNNYERRNS